MLVRVSLIEHVRIRKCVCVIIYPLLPFNIKRVRCVTFVLFVPVWTQQVRRSGCANRSRDEYELVTDREPLISIKKVMTGRSEEQQLDKEEQERRTAVGHL